MPDPDAVADSVELRLWCWHALDLTTASSVWLRSRHRPDSGGIVETATRNKWRKMQLSSRLPRVDLGGAVVRTWVFGVLGSEEGIAKAGSWR